MERQLSLSNFDVTANRLRFASKRAGVRIEKFLGWFRDKGRQIRYLAQDEDLIRAVFAAEKTPDEGARYKIGETVKFHSPHGESRRFRICGVNSGGFSNVYIVIDLDEMRPYCLKESRDTPGDENEKHARLGHEAAISLKLGPHPNLVTTYAAFLGLSRLHILTEYVSGSSLDQMLKQGRIPLKKALSFSVQVCRAMSHIAGILPGFVHGDIKPGNCMITTDGVLKLGDFGLSSDAVAGIDAVTDSYPDSKDISGTRYGWGGTTPYMAPEMFDRTAPDRELADIYAFGVTLFELLAGTRPFKGESKSEIIEMHRHRTPPMELLEPAGLPRALTGLVERCLAKRKEDRPSSFAELETELCAIYRSKFDAEPAVSPTVKPDENETYRRAVSAGLLGAADIAFSGSAGANPEARAVALAYRAIALEQAGRLEDAYAASTSALMTRADLFIVLLAHARVLIARGDVDIAENYLDRALRLEPANFIGLNLMGNVLNRTGQHEEAIRYFDRAVAVDSRDPGPYEGLARSHYALGKFEEAIRFALRALLIDPFGAPSYAILGDAYRAAGDLFHTVANYKKAIGRRKIPRSLRRKYVQSCLDLFGSQAGTESRQMIRLLVDASRNGTRATPSHSGSEAFVRRFLDVLDESGHEPLLIFFTEHAISSVLQDLSRETASELEAGVRSGWQRCAGAEQHSEVFYAMGRIFFSLGDYARCRECFRDVLARFGADEMAYYYLAACAEMLDEFDLSLSYYKKALLMKDCEDNRAGVRRTSRRLTQAAGARASLSR